MHVVRTSSRGQRRGIDGAVAGLVVGLLLALGPAAAPASATTLFVAKNDPNCTDAGTGTAAQPFCSIGAAAASVNLNAGDTVQVSGGTYDEGQRVSLSRSGTATAPIIFRAVPGETVTVTGTKNAFYTNGKAYVTIQGYNLGRLGL